MALTGVSTLALLPVLLLLLHRYVIYPALLSPLSYIPCVHWSSRFSSIWIFWTRFKERENRLLLIAHQKHGPVVRLAPNEISINDVETLKTVYSGGFEKGQWYSFFDNYGVPCTFSSLASRPHSARKKMHSNIYSKSYIHSSTAALRQAKLILHDRLLPYLTQQSSTSDGFTPAIDVLELWNATMMDFITAYIFGMQGCYNFIQDVELRKDWLKLFHSRKPYAFYSQEAPRLTRSLKALGIRLIPRWVDFMNEKLEQYTQQSCKSTLLYLKNQGSVVKDSELGNEPVVFKAVLNGISKEQKLKGASSVLIDETLRFPDLSIASETIDNLAAGQETSGITLTYLTWHLSRNIGLQNALRAELLSLAPEFNISSTSDDMSQVPEPRILDALPILHAIVMETLRLNAAIPGSLPRLTPYPSCTIGPYTKIPGGVRISARAHNLHRNADVFPEPEKFDHDRWMNDENVLNDNERSERERWFWAFGSGGRMCLGKNFALHAMKMTIAAIYTNFRTHIVDDEGIEQKDGWTCGPKSNKLKLKFERLIRNI